MITKIKVIGLVVGIVVSLSFSADADQLISDDLIVGGVRSDGTALEYDCAAPRLPFFLNPTQVSPDAAIGTIPSGDLVYVPEPIQSTCDLTTGPPYMCEFTCKSDGASACAGFDCVNGESFDGDALRLKENNVRIRFHNTAVGDVLGESWNIEANSAQNGGLSYFGFQVKSVEKDTPVISDGTAWPLYDCSQTLLDPSIYPTQVMDPDCPGAPGCAERNNLALIPAGQPVIDVKRECNNVNQQIVCEYQCVQRLDYTVKSVFTLGTAADNPAFNDGIAIGYESAPEEGVISVGRAGLARRLARVAAGINSTDALTREGLKIDTVVKLVRQITEANTELDEIEDRIARLEARQQNIDNMVTRFYRMCLGRKPDQDGLNGWAKALWDGASTGSDVAYGFVLSPEFLQQKTTNEQYLTILYNAFFDRSPDPAGLQGWLDALSNGSSREEVLNGFIYAAEFAELCDKYGIKAFEGYMTKSQKVAAVEAFVARFYNHCLNRAPDAPGMEEWKNNLLNHLQTGSDVAHGFMDSIEFLAKNTTNEAYLTILYKAFFDRDPDQDGWDAWLAELDSGRERNFVLDGFLYSQEFAGLCKTYDINPY